MDDMTVAQRLGAFAAGLGAEELLEAVSLRAKSCLLHALVVGLAGSVADFGRQAEQISVGVTDPRPGLARSLRSGLWHPTETAAFINGVQLHARAQEDTHGTFHPGVCVIPAALAAAEGDNADGATILAAVVAGYEVGIALSGSLTELTTPPFRATAVFGPVAAAAAAGRVRGLDAETMTSALAIAVSMSGGTAESFGAGTDEWHFQSGGAAAIGVRAVQLARAGVTGSPAAIESASGFLDCFAPNSVPPELGVELGRVWNMLGVTFKPYPVCAFNQTPAMLAVRFQQKGHRAQDISSITLRMNEREATYPGMPSAGPFTSVVATLMSARFAFASALTRGDITYATLLDFEDADIMDMVAKIDLIPEPDRRPKTAHAQVTLADGTTCVDAIEDSDVLLSWDMDGVLTNARRLAAEAGLGAPEFQDLVDAVCSVELMASPGPLVSSALAMKHENTDTEGTSDD
jgi:2-methylcitrate dehydratase PrpD